jgi:2,3-bisphosphoglycerate-dependent phosphoglycerate mutase
LTLELIFETHSISVDNERGIATGWHDGALSERGRALAAELGERHRAHPPLAVHTSDLGRAVETAEIAFAATGVPIVRDGRLRECDYGDLTGMPVERLVAERVAHIDVAFPGGESYRDVVVRVEGFLADLRERYAEGVLVAIGHSATHYALDLLLNAVPLESSIVAPFAWQPGWAYLLD